MARRSRRSSLHEPIPGQALDNIALAERDANTIQSLLDHRTGGRPIDVAAKNYVHRYSEIVEDPERWVPSYIEDTIDLLAAFAPFFAGEPICIPEATPRVTLERALRRHVYSAWMMGDATRLAAGDTVFEPFMCDVPARHIGQRKAYRVSAKDAAEYWVLSRFLPMYCKETGRLLSFVRKGEPNLPGQRTGEPDFVLQDQADGRLVGVEVTDAIDPSLAARERFFWGLAAELLDQLAGCLGVITIHDRQYGRASDVKWEVIANKHPQQFVSACVQGTQGRWRNEFMVSVEDTDGLKDVLVHFQRRRKGELRILHTDQYGWSGDKPEQIAVTNLVRALENKVTKLDPYSTPETLLVVYPINFVPTFSYQRVLDMGLSDARQAIAGSTRFQEIWVCKEQQLWSIPILR